MERLFFISCEIYAYKVFSFVKKHKEGMVAAFQSLKSLLSSAKHCEWLSTLLINIERHGVFDEFGQSNVSVLNKLILPYKEWLGALAMELGTP